MTIRKLQLSFIQIEAIPEPLRSLHPPAIPFAFLLSGPLYENEMAQVLARKAAAKPPWSGGYASMFWTRYISAKQARPKDLWRGLVPLYYEVPARVSAPWFTGSVFVRVYLYPWGIGAVAVVNATGMLELEQAVKLAFNVQRLGRYSCSVDGKTSEVPMKGVLETVISKARRDAFGPGIPAGKATDMFTISSVMEADGADDTSPVADGGEVHRALEAMTGWNQYWKTMKLDDLNDHKIEIRQSPAGHFLYGSRRGRAVWFPAGFGSGDALKCYHQNLTMASLQNESLCALVNDGAGATAAGRSLSDFSVAYQACLKNAAGILGRVYGGTLDTYRSCSLRHQIDKTYRSAVDTVRQLCKMPVLTP